MLLHLIVALPSPQQLTWFPRHCLGFKARLFQKYPSFKCLANLSSSSKLCPIHPGERMLTPETLSWKARPELESGNSSKSQSGISKLLHLSTASLPKAEQGSLSLWEPQEHWKGVPHNPSLFHCTTHLQEHWNFPKFKPTWKWTQTIWW